MRNMFDCMKCRAFLGSCSLRQLFVVRCISYFTERVLRKEESDGILSCRIYSPVYFPCQILLMDPSHREIAVRSKGAYFADLSSTHKGCAGINSCLKAS